MTCLRSAIFLSAPFEPPMTKSLACQTFWGNRNDISIVDMEGTPGTAGAHGQCLLTSKELTSKVKTSRDAQMAVIPTYTVDNPRVGWIVWKKK